MGEILYRMDCRTDYSQISETHRFYSSIRNYMYVKEYRSEPRINVSVVRMFESPWYVGFARLSLKFRMKNALKAIEEFTRGKIYNKRKNFFGSNSRTGNFSFTFYALRQFQIVFTYTIVFNPFNARTFLFPIL